MASVFLVEDDPKIREELKVLLQKYGHSCIPAEDFAQIPEMVERLKPQIVLLDINLPVFDGFYLCREIRRFSTVPILVVTSRDSEMDELMSMNLGADDFVTKPYNTQILLARIAALLKRAYPAEAGRMLEHKGVSLNLGNSEVSFQGRCVELSKNETRILARLLDSPGVIVSREDIMNDLWQSDEFVDDNTLTVNINRLRHKLEEIGIQGFLITRRGQGYQV